jgi:drug/metabolite transporter (DMT)-like permease
MAAPSPTRRTGADLALLALACMWGATFPAGKDILRFLPPFTYLAVRFAIATAILLPLALRDVRRVRAADWRWAGLAGLMLGTGFVFQTLGLRLAGATVSAFLTAVSVVLVPMFGLLLGKRATTLEWLGVGSATAGLALLTLGGPLRPGLGELLLLGCAAAFAWHIIVMDRTAAVVPAFPLGMAQTFVTGLLCTLFVPTERLPREVPSHVWPTVVALAVFGSAVAFTVQAWAQRVTTPTRVGLMLTFEPLAAALFAYVWLGERLAARQWIGAAFIVAGIVLAEVKVGTRGGPKAEQPATRTDR